MVTVSFNVHVTAVVVRAGKIFRVIMRRELVMTAIGSSCLTGNTAMHMGCWPPNSII